MVLCGWYQLLWFRDIRVYGIAHRDTQFDWQTDMVIDDFFIKQNRVSAQRTFGQSTAEVIMHGAVHLFLWHMHYKGLCPRNCHEGYKEISRTDSH